MRRYLALVLPVLVLLLTAGPARADTAVGSLLSVDPERTATDALTTKTYSYTAATAHCAYKNVLGTVLFATNTRYHWSWWLQPNSAGVQHPIKNWWRETVVPTSVALGWKYDHSFVSNQDGGIGQAYKLVQVTSEFTNSQAGYTLTRYIRGEMLMWGPKGSVHCST